MSRQPQNSQPTEPRSWIAAKYRPAPRVHLPDRRWPDRIHTAPPRWCSVDLRDGNQALAEPMDLSRKQQLFELLVALGFKEIEVAFPSASSIEYDFVRWLIEERGIPSDVTIQVITQAREHLIERTFEAICGAHRVIVHLYNSTSPIQRRCVFGKSDREVIELAVDATQLICERTRTMPQTELTFQYSPESFSSTELEFSRDICEAVIDTWRPDAARPMILNLPNTVEVATPNNYADQIEWFDRALKRRREVTLSIHTHNDRGCAVAAAELALLAGAERVEGTLFGNGERTGNVDLVTLALNLHTQGVDPGLDLSEIDHVVQCVEHCNRLPVHQRHPYAGELVYTAYSGSHQDAIRKVLLQREQERANGTSAAATEGADTVWNVPYLPLDPYDVGRSYDALVHVNSQSGKGGVTFVLEQAYGIVLDAAAARALATLVQAHSEQTGRCLTAEDIHALYERHIGRCNAHEASPIEGSLAHVDA